MAISNVTTKDFDGLESDNINALHSAVKSICNGIEGDALWEKIREMHNLKNRGDGPNFVNRMNAAIAIWNNANPTSTNAIKQAFGV